MEEQTVEIKNSESQTVELKIIKKDKESKLRIGLLDGESSESNVEKKPKNTSRNNSFSTPSTLPAQILSPIFEDREMRSFPEIRDNIWPGKVEGAENEFLRLVFCGQEVDGLSHYSFLIFLDSLQFNFMALRIFYFYGQPSSCGILKRSSLESAIL